MSSKRVIAANVQEVWSKLNSQWRGTDADAFYNEFVVRISETAEYFEDACAELESVSSELMKELDEVERSLAI